MKRRKPERKHRPLRVQITNEEIMRDLLFPALPHRSKAAYRNAGRR